MNKENITKILDIGCGNAPIPLILSTKKPWDVIPGIMLCKEAGISEKYITGVICFTNPDADLSNVRCSCCYTLEGLYQYFLSLMSCNNSSNAGLLFPFLALISLVIVFIY